MKEVDENMITVAENVRRELIKLVPASILEEVTCFVFYDNHPQDEKRLDITVCTKTGDIKEYFQRDLVSSVNLQGHTHSTPEEIIIMRNSKSELYYVVRAESELYFVSSKGKLKLNTKVLGVAEFSVHDSSCTGQPYLKVIKNNDAVPIIFDENLNSGDMHYSTRVPSNPQPILEHLKRKYIEAKYSVKNYEQSIEGYIRLRHEATLNSCQNINPNHSISKSGTSVIGSLKVQTLKPWVKVCNTKIIVALKVLNEYEQPVEDVQILINSGTRRSLTYVTKLFESNKTQPFWKQTDNQQLLPNRRATVVAVMDLEEIKKRVIDKIVLGGALSYKTVESTYLMPFEDLVIPSLDTLGDEFDALSSAGCDEITMLAILSTTEKTDLRVRKVKPEAGGESFMEFLIKYMEMERIGPNMIVYKKSPYHALNGVLLHFLDGGTERAVNISVYTRTKSQVLTLIRFINDAVPADVIITPHNYIITAKIAKHHELSDPKHEIPQKDYLGCAETVVNRTKLILEYLDEAMVRMNESNNPDVQQLIGSKIDLYACGLNSYNNFRERMIEEANKGVKCLLNEKTAPDYEAMDVE